MKSRSETAWGWVGGVYLPGTESARRGIAGRNQTGIERQKTGPQLVYTRAPLAPLSCENRQVRPPYLLSFSDAKQLLVLPGSAATVDIWRPGAARSAQVVLGITVMEGHKRAGTAGRKCIFSRLLAFGTAKITATLLSQGNNS